RRAAHADRGRRARLMCALSVAVVRDSSPQSAQRAQRFRQSIRLADLGVLGALCGFPQSGHAKICLTAAARWRRLISYISIGLRARSWLASGGTTATHLLGGASPTESGTRVICARAR